MQPDIRPISQNIYKLYESVTYKIWVKAILNKRDASFLMNITIPAGFFSDGQSVPQFLWWFMRPDGLVRIAALSHDALYRARGGKETPIVGGINNGISINVERTKDKQPLALTRKQCDLIYLAFYKKYAPKEKNKARIGYRMLRLFGKRHFGGPIPAKKKERK